MADTYNIRDLVRETHACVVNAFLGVPHIPISLHGITVSGLRDRKYHRHGNAFIKVSVDNREVFKTDVSPEPTAPTWTFAHPKILSIYPSSIIRFCVFRWHRHQQTEEFVGEVEGTAWTFCSESSYKQPSSEDSPNLSIHPSLSFDLPETSYTQPKPEDIDIIEVERHRIEVLKKQRDGRNQGGFVKTVLPSILDATMEDMDGLLRLLEHVAPAIPLSRIAILLLHGVQRMVKAHGQVDSDIEDLLKLLRETLLHASNCDGEDLKRQAVKLVGDSASIVDGWVHSRSGKQLIKATYIQQRIKAFHTQITEFNDMLKTKVNKTDKQQPTKRPAPSLEISQPQDLPELDCSDTASVPDSPAPETPPATHAELDAFHNLKTTPNKADGPLTHIVKEVEVHWGEWHHVKEHGIRADGEIGIIGNVSPI